MKPHKFVFGESRAFIKLIEQVDRYAAAQFPILILGETGVGKDLIAQRIHERSLRRGLALVPVNCGALPGGLFESELFGYERGAFSGAVNSQRGLLRFGNGGTVFFDEIADLELLSQVKLLRFLDSGEVRPVGSTKLDRVDVRVVAATNVDLHAAVADGRFRLDLLERLSVLTLAIPPLRERPEDIAGIARHYLESMGARYHPSVMGRLEAYEWPGNVRQLKNVLARASLLAAPAVTATLVERLIEEEYRLAPLRRRSTAERTSQFSPPALADIEKQVILDRLKSCRGNRKRTAKELGIAKSTLHEKLRRWKFEASSENTPFDDLLTCALGS